MTRAELAEVAAIDSVFQGQWCANYFFGGEPLDSHIPCLDSVASHAFYSQQANNHLQNSLIQFTITPIVTHAIQIC